MRKASIVFVFIASIVLIASSAMALPTNTRPVTPLAGSEKPLWDIFTDIGATSYAADYLSTQSNAAVFTNGASGGTVASFIIAIAGNASTNVSGLYKYGSPGTLVPIFSGASGPAQATVTFLGNGTVIVTPTFGSGIIGGTYAGFGNQFGFYLAGAGNTFYSEDSLNQGGNAQALIYQGNDSDQITVPGFAKGTFLSTEYLFAWEDLPYAGTDKDFNDLVYIVESIRPVPEPMTLVLVGAGLLGLGILRRKS
jgi:hypothetical protein